MRKILLFFVLILFSLQAWAGDTFTVDGVTYTITDATNKTVEIGTGAGGAASTPAISRSFTGAFTLPSTVSYNGDTYTVTAIGDYAFFACKLSAISIPSSIKSIGIEAFYACDGLKFVQIPNAVTTISVRAFYLSSSTSIFIPTSVTSISNDAFAGADVVTVDPNNPNYSSKDGVLFDKTATTLIHCPISASQITIPNTIVTIASGACDECINLTSIEIPNSVTFIGMQAFQNCISLTSMYIPKTVSSIQDDAFIGCTRLPAIIVDDDNPNFSSVDGVLFNKDQTVLLAYPRGKLNKCYNIPSTVTSIGRFAFSQSSVKCLIIPTSVKSLGRGAFTDTTPTSVYVSALPSNINLDEYSFGFISACNLYVPAHSKTLFAVADQWKNFGNIIEGDFTPCISISTPATAIYFGSSVMFTASVIHGGTDPAYQWYLNGNPVSGAISNKYTSATIKGDDKVSCVLTSNLPCATTLQATSNTITMSMIPVAPLVSITSSTTKIYSEGSVTFTATPTNGGTAPAYQWYLNGVAISGATNNVYESATLKDNDEISCVLTSNFPYVTTSSATSNIITMEVSNFFTSAGIGYYVTSPSYPYTAKVANDGEVSYTGNVVIPSSVSYCGTTFRVTSIGNLAFCGSNDLLSVTIPSSVTTIENGAFIDTNGLTSIVVDTSNPNYYSNNGVLFNKQATMLITCPEGKSGSYTIPSGVTAIADSAFIQCDRLTSVTLPSSLTTIGDKAFMDCSNITSITFPLSIKNIKDEVFTNCTGLKDIHVKNASPSDIELGVSVFYGVSGSDCILYVPTGSKSFYLDVYPWNKFQIVEDANLFAVYVATGSVGGVATGGGTYELGSFCSLKATPSVGYGFLAWMENDTIRSTSPIYCFPVSGTHTFVPNYGKICTISASVNPSACGVVNGARSYVAGQLCLLTATASSSYVFANWTEGGSEVSKDANYTFKVDGDRILVANFVPSNNTISATSSSISNGTVSGGAIYTYGSSCTLTATPKSGYVFTGWTESGSVVSTKSKYTFTVTSARALVANFEAVKVVVTQPDGSSVTSYPSFLYGTATVTPASGFLYSVDGKAYQSANVFNTLAIGTHSIILKSLADSVLSSPVFVNVNASKVITAQNYKVQATNCSCRDTKDGKIQVTLDKLYEYEVRVVGTNDKTYDKSIIFTDKTFSLSNLPADTYTLTFKIDYLDNYVQTFTVIVSQPEDLSVLKVNAAPNSAQYSVSGGSNYFVVVNDQTTENNGGNINVSLQPGENRIKIYTDKLCQGVYEETIYNDLSGQLSLFPNPTKGKITIGIPEEDKDVTIDLFSLNGQLLRKYKYQISQSKLVDMDISDFANGAYIVKVNGSVIHRSLRVVKQ